MFHLRKLIFCTAIAASLYGCGDDGDDKDTNGTSGSSGSSSAGSSNEGGSNSGSAGETGNAGESTGGTAGSGSSSAPGGAGGETSGEGGEGGESEPVSPYPKFPAAIAFNGCANVGPICTVKQNEGELSLQCGTRAFAGTIKENGDYVVTGTPLTSGTTTVTTTTTTCTGNVRPSGVTGTCENTVSPPPASDSATTTCTLAAARPLPGISCVELPSAFSTFQFDATDIGECQLVQNNCSFQADCEGAIVVGTATPTGANFNYTLKAKESAAAPEGGTPAFLKDANVSHACTTTLAGDALQGSCSAGAYSARGATPIPATSVYDFEAVASVPVPVCSAIGPFTEDLFVLDSCEILEQGEPNVPGIGEPICAFQQNGCVWKVTCITDPAQPLVFGGKLAPGQTKVDWRLTTGTPCEATFDANGNLSGKCTVPGQPSCALKSKAPAPAVGCPQLGTTFTSRGCGNDADGIPLECRLSLQHGCDFAAICDFNVSRFPDTIFAGKTSTVGGVDYMKFPGLGGRSCSVQRATEAEYSNPATCRTECEWYGDCLTPTGGKCADTFQCVADENGNYPSPFSNIRRGLRLFFD